MASVLHPAPKISSNEGVRETLVKALGKHVLASKEKYGEIVIGVEREAIEDVLRTLRDEHGYQPDNLAREALAEARDRRRRDDHDQEQVQPVHNSRPVSTW